jgi:RNA polymerase sigma factor (TIGR02999 family)
MAATATDTTQLLVAARSGDRVAFDLLFSRVYDELRQIAHQRLARQRPGETLNTTALVHEAYLRLVDPAVAGPNDRAHFLALASRAMRFIVVDQARAKQVEKRGGGKFHVPLDEEQMGIGESFSSIIALDQALERLSSLSERQSRLVEYRFFGGLTYEEISEVMDVPVRTIKRDWMRARTWLHEFMTATAEPAT